MSRFRIRGGKLVLRGETMITQCIQNPSICPLDRVCGPLEVDLLLCPSFPRPCVPA